MVAALAGAARLKVAGLTIVKLAVDSARPAPATPSQRLWEADAIQRFVARQNIEHYRNLLATELEPQRRAQIEHLLAEATAELERAEQRAEDTVDPKPRP